MKLSEMKTSTEVLEEKLANPDFRAEWEAGELGRQVALALVSYRAAHGLTQSDVARAAGISQPAVARLEAGVHDPRLETLYRLARAFGFGIRIAIGPSAPVDFRVETPAWSWHPGATPLPC